MNATTAWSDATLAAPRPDHPAVGGYEVLALLRAGDAGPLYRVRDAALGRDLMLEEFLPPALAARDASGQVQPALPAAAPLLDRARRRFVDESRVLAGHEQPHLARVLHVVEAGGTVCRVMPGYPGRPLSDLLAEGAAPRDEAHIRSLLADLMVALEAWHNLAGPYGGVHASRVLWSPDGHALLLGPDAASRTTLGAPEADDAQEQPPAAHRVAADVQSALALARACMRTHPGGAAAYSAALRETLEAAPGLVTPARVLERLARASSSVAPPVTPPVMPPAPAAARPATAPATPPVSPPITPLLTPLGAMPAAAPLPSPAPAGDAASRAAADTEVDPATAALIRSIVDAIPEREPPLPGSRKKMPGDVHFDLGIAGPDPLSRPAPAPAKAPMRAGLVVGLAVLVLVALGLGALTYLRFTGGERVPRPAAARTPAGVPATPAPTTATAPVTSGVVTSAAVPASAAAAPASTPLPPAAAASVITLAPTPEAPLSVVTPSGARADTPRATTAAAAPPTERSSNTRRSAAAATTGTTTASTATPRQQCGARSGFSLYRCMEQQCATPRWRRHAQCVQMRQTDTVPE